MRLHAKRAVLLRKGDGEAVKHGMQAALLLQNGARLRRLPLPERLKGEGKAFPSTGDDAVTDLLPQRKAAQLKMIVPAIRAFGRDFAFRTSVHAQKQHGPSVVRIHAAVHPDRFPGQRREGMAGEAAVLKGNQPLRQVLEHHRALLSITESRSTNVSGRMHSIRSCAPAAASMIRRTASAPLRAIS